MESLSFPAQKPDVIGIGTAYLDIEAQVDNDVISSLGLRLHMWMRMPDLSDFESLLNKVKAHLNIERLPATLGGSAGNVVRALQFLGTPTSLYCKLGNDPVSLEYKQAMERLGAGVMDRPSTTPVSRILVLVENGGRKFICNQTLSLDLRPEDLSKELFEGVKTVHLEGYAIEEFQVDFLKRAAELAKECGAFVTFDCGSDLVVKNNIEKVLDLLAQVDIVFANEDEVKVLSESEIQELEEDRVKGLPLEGRVASFLLTKCSTVVFLQGARGASVFSRSEDPFSSPALVESVEACNTNGAGDSFIAGFLHGILHGYSLQDSAWLGNLVAGEVVKVDGTQIPGQKSSMIQEKIRERFTASEKVG